MVQTVSTLKVSHREGSKKYRAFHLRASGVIPGIVYGRGLSANIPVVVPLKEFTAILASGSHLVTLDIEGDARPAMIQAVQRGTFGTEILHADFRTIREDETVDVTLPIVLIGEALGVKTGGMIEQSMHSAIVRCRPADMPERLTMQIDALDINVVLHLSSLDPIPGVTVLAHDDPAVVSCRLPRGETAATDSDAESSASPEVIAEKEREAREAKK